MSDYYNILGVQSTASQDEIKRAYKKLAREHHPDVNGGDGNRFKEISEAHDTLKDPKKRQEYDSMSLYFLCPFSSFTLT